MSRTALFSLLALTTGCGKVDRDADGSPEGEDCDDNNPARFPGAPEICDSIDNDCDDTVDEDAPADLTYYEDQDGDGFGNPDSTQMGCLQPEGFVPKIGDCDDTEALANPDLDEVCNDSIDNDCDGVPNQCVLPGTLYVSNYAAASVLLGENANSFAGGSVDRVGDWTGDGKDDILVAAPYAGKDYAGAVYVSADPGPGDHAIADSDLIIRGVVPKSGFGGAVAGADLDGNGSPEIFIGAPGDSDGGSVYGFSAPGAGELTADDADVTLLGTVKKGFGGYWVRRGGDFADNGGVSLLVGAPVEGKDAGGSLYVITTPPGTGELDLDTGVGTRFMGVDKEAVGVSGTSAGDTNGDGLDDLVFSSFAEVGYLFESPLPTGLVLASDADELFVPDTTFGCAPAMSGVGDVTGDGKGDLAVGSYCESSYDFWNGKAWVYEGPVTDGARSAALATLEGRSYASAVGNAVDGFGDFDADGVGDFLVGAQYNTGTNTFSGAAFLVLGPVVAGVDEIDSLASSMYGSQGLGYVGYSVAMPGDVNGDGRADLLIGGPVSGLDLEGETYIVYGIGW